MFRLVVLSVAVAVAAANPNAVWGAGLATPLAAGLATPLAASWATPWAAGVAAPLAVATPLGASNYRGPLSLAPGQPANILAADGRPLDTLSVNLDRAVHLTAKAVEGSGHWLKKRSIVSAPLVAGPLAAAPVAWGRSWAAPAPIAVAAAPIAPWGLGVGARVGIW
ncbi:myosin-1-like [Pararge aegeria]|uniref:Jg25865 protein n=1 Tax=Pararge aegeria aegeria TaxID=348720 RepID=A0A8S4RPP6_9NEOP|nr:myosin-1-like [Pararge aegeria]CAH2240321.1 jg25865 [Pararge aegeria aegeria]